MAKNQNTETAVTTTLGDYAVMQHTVEDLQNIITSNLGNAELGPGDLDRIKVPAGGGTTWSIPSLDGDLDSKYLEGVIAAWKDQRAYWKESFSGGNAPPDCASDDGIMGMGDPGGVCAKCPHAQFESAIGDDGKTRPGQACKQIRLMAIVQKNDLVPTLIAAPPTSLANMRKYFLRLSSAAVPFYGVITRFSLEKARSQGGIEYSQIIASSQGRLTDQELQKMTGYVQVIGKSLERQRGHNEEDYSE